MIVKRFLSRKLCVITIKYFNSNLYKKVLRINYFSTKMTALRRVLFTDTLYNEMEFHDLR